MKVCLVRIPSNKRHLREAILNAVVQDPRLEDDTKVMVGILVDQRDPEYFIFDEPDGEGEKWDASIPGPAD